MCRGLSRLTLYGFVSSAACNTTGGEVLSLENYVVGNGIITLPAGTLSAGTYRVNVTAQKGYDGE